MEAVLEEQNLSTEMLVASLNVGTNRPHQHLTWLCPSVSGFDVQSMGSPCLQ